MSEEIQVRFDEHTYSIEPNQTIMEAAKKVGVYIPHLCYHSDLMPGGQCGLCIVKIDGAKYCYSCMTQVRDNMYIDTQSTDVLDKSRKAYDSFMDMTCPPESEDIEDVTNHLYPKRAVRIRRTEKTDTINFDAKKCIKCTRCTRMCGDTLDIGALDDPIMPLRSSNCISCGLCLQVCPTKAITETPHISRILQALANGYNMVLIVDPSVCNTIGEAFDMPKGTDVTGRIINAARAVGFKAVIDGRVGVDLSAQQHALALLDRISDDSNLPLVTSQCTGVINYFEKINHTKLRHLAPVKPPVFCGARVLRTNRAFENAFIVSLSGCVAAKGDLNKMVFRNIINASLTAREFVDLLGMFEVNICSQMPGAFDVECPQSIASAVSVAGGFTQLILRHCGVTEDLSFLFDPQTVAEKEVIVKDKPIKVAVINGIQHVIDIPLHDYSLIEIAACPDGCINGGGQPRLNSHWKAKPRIDAIRKLAEQPFIPATSPLDPYICSLLGTHFEPQEYATRKRKAPTTPLVAYGSAGGRAMGLARLIASAIQAPSVSMQKVHIKDMIARKTVIFIVTTIGNGVPPPNAAAFYKELEASSEDLSDVKYAVLACGSSEFTETYCAAGIALDKMMRQHGGKALVPLTKIDKSDPDAGEDTYAEWAKQITDALFLQRPKIGKMLLSTLKEIQDPTVAEADSRPLGFELAKMVEHELLSAIGEIPMMHTYALVLPPGMTYEVGDHVDVLPRNDEPVVDAVIQALKYDPDLVFQVHNKGDSLIPPQVSVKQLFSQYLDLNCMPTDDLINAFHDSLNDEGKDKLAHWEGLNVGEFLIYFAAYGAPNFDTLVSVCPQIKPRVISIISAPNKRRGYLEMMVLDVIFNEGKQHGLVTYFLTKALNQMVPLRIAPGCFYYPKNIQAPIIIVGLGTGMAPMLALIQHREELKGEGKKLGKCLVVFGSRNKTAYPLLFKKIARFLEIGAIDDVLTAFSRDVPSCHFQDAMSANASLVWDYWSEATTEMFFCGPNRGGEDSLKELMVTITINMGWMAREEAMAYSGRHEFHTNH